MPAEVAIIGAGPAGLATDACLRANGIAFRLLDRTGEPGGAYRSIYPNTVLASPVVHSVLPGFSPAHADEYITAGRYLEYLRAYADHHRLVVERADVERLERSRGRFVLREADREREARAVVVATGMFGFPRPVTLAGTPTVPVLHSRDWRGPADLPPGDVLVIGGGNSAVEVAEEAATAGRRVFLVSRTPLRFTRQRLFGRDVHDVLPVLEWIPTWAARGFCARPPTFRPVDLGFARLRDRGQISVHSGLVRVDGDRVRFRSGDERCESPGWGPRRPARRGGAEPRGIDEARVAAIVYATGYQFLTPFVPPEVARAPAGHLRARANESVTWSGLFVVGAPCARGLASEFLRGIARDAARLPHRISDAG